MTDQKRTTRQQEIDDACNQCAGNYHRFTEQDSSVLRQKIINECNAQGSCSLWPFRPITEDKNNGRV